MVAHPTYYVVIVKGHLGLGLQAAFAQMDCTAQPDGTTHITGYLPDQAAVFAILNTIERLGLPLISMQAHDR